MEVQDAEETENIGNAVASVDDVLKANQGKVTGIIIPPPEIRAVVDKTAQFVARNGKSFENKILNSGEGKTSKFNFMKPYDPYHAYYEFKIREFEEGKPLNEPKVQPSPVSEIDKKDSQTEAAQAPPKPSSTMITKASIASPFAKFANSKPKEAPPSFEFSVGHPSGLNALDIDIVKLTAQYTALHGREFLGGLVQREQRNPQFDFLKPTHMLFAYFTSLVDAYTKIIQPSASLKEKVKAKRSRLLALESAVRRWEWARAEEERKKREVKEADAERSAFQSIDWADFVVVETIAFPEDELLEIPALRPSGTVTDEMDMDTDMDAVRAHAPPPPPMRPPPALPVTTSEVMEMEEEVEEEEDQDMRIVTDYKPRTKAPVKSSLTMLDPVSGRTIPVSEMSEHMRVQLMDSRWREEQKRFLDKQQGTGFASGVSVVDNLKKFANQREDIFGSTEDEEASQREADEGRRRRALETNRIIWDGHQATAAATQQAKDSLAARLPPPPPPTSQPTPIGPSATPVSTTTSVVPVRPAVPPPAPASVLPPVTAAAIPRPILSLPNLPLPVPPPMIIPPPPVFVAPALAPPLPMMPPPPMIPPPPMMGMGPPLPLPIALGYPPQPGGMIVGGNPMMMMQNQGPGQRLYDDGGSNEQLAKRTKIGGESELIPENEFASRFTGPITVSVVVPADTSAAASGWTLNGQTLHITLSVRDTVKDLKELIAPQVNNMPVNKQQLKAQGGFLKDTQTLASLNIGEGSVVELSMRSRGGKK